MLVKMSESLKDRAPSLLHLAKHTGNFETGVLAAGADAI